MAKQKGMASRPWTHPKTSFEISLKKAYDKSLCKFVEGEIYGGKVPIFPPEHHLFFNALNSTQFDGVKAVIIGHKRRQLSPKNCYPFAPQSGGSSIRHEIAELFQHRRMARKELDG